MDLDAEFDGQFALVAAPALASRAAKTGWVEPDLAPFPA